MIPLVDLAAIPADLAREDYLAAGLDLFGAIPVVGEVGEVADVAKLVKMADNVADAAKIANKATDIGKPVIKMPKLPKSPSKLKSSGWKETTPTAMKKNTTSKTFKKDGLTIRFDQGKKGLVVIKGKTIIIY